ncbi:hypothetical protein QN092_16510 [Proteus vulgaris]|nr:hypothetical protein [Proteus vulgaris]WIF71556.1 hypothetical protein QN092_16510 [Proteus vulgaris]
MNSTLPIVNNKIFILLLEDSKKVSFDENDLFTFIKYKDEELKVFNKDKMFIFSNFNYELKNTLDKYILNKKDRLDKLNKIILKEGLVNNIIITDGKVDILNLNSGDDLNRLFSSLLKNKNKHSTLFKMLFSDKNVLINKFISKDKKEIFHNIDKIANKINNNGVLSLIKNRKQLEVYDKKMSVMLEVQSINPEVVRTENDCDNKSIEAGSHNNIKHSKKEKQSDDLKLTREKNNEISKEINKLTGEINNENLKIIKEINEKKERLNEYLEALNESSLNVMRSIIHISHLINCNDENIDNKFINELSIDVNKLRDRGNNINLNSNFFKLSVVDLNERLNEVNLIISDLDINIKKMAGFKVRELNAIYEEVDSYKLFTIYKDDVDFKKYFFNKIRDASSQLCLYHESLENPKRLFFRMYKYFFPSKYLEKQKKSNNAFNKLNMLYENLFLLLQSKDFKNNLVPKWACKLVAKTINESLPMNDIFWRFSKERTEWNKIYKEFILEK